MSFAGSAGPAPTTLPYRPDIDGLRAVAVLSVILAHAGVPFVAGGFLGVDVFYVISGYLIASILRRELGEGRFTMRRFLERRARRILPALLVVIVACVPFAFWLMLPEFLQNFGQSVAATLLFANNLLLAMTSGYWDLESGFKPLLHTWSLGVEEQFYLTFPVLLAAVWRFGQRAQVATIVALGLVSFAISEHGWRTYPVESFYLPTSRAWELMAGCALAYVQRRPRKWDGLLAALSLLAVVAPMMLFDGSVPSPSLYSAVPVLGAAGLIVFSRRGTLACRALSWRPVVFVGLISYSAYLWHQPVFAFARLASFGPLGAGTMAGLALLTLVLAAISWRLVEVPFRKAEVVPLRRFVPAMAIVTAALAGLGFVLHFQHGFPRRAFPNLGEASEVRIAYNERVRRLSAQTFPRNGRPNVLLLGTSHARDVGNVLIESGAVAGKNLVYQSSLLGCEPGSVDDGVPRALLAEASVVVVGLYHPPGCVRRIARELERSSRAPLVFFGPKNFGYNVNPFARVPLERRDTAYATAAADTVFLNAASARIVGAERYVDLVGLLGPDGRRVRFFDEGGNPIASDRTHLTRYGARYLARRLESAGLPAFRTIQRAARVVDGEPSGA